MAEKKTKTSKKKTSKKNEYFEAIGRRKSATARVRLFQKPATGKKVGNIDVGDKTLAEYFPLKELQEIVYAPLKQTKLAKEFYISAKTYGGGVRAQAEAIRLGISRALLKFNIELRQELKDEGFLTRDARVKERKKFGLKKARKAAQWSKR